MCCPMFWRRRCQTSFSNLLRIYCILYLAILVLSMFLFLDNSDVMVNIFLPGRLYNVITLFLAQFLSSNSYRQITCYTHILYLLGFLDSGSLTHSRHSPAPSQGGRTGEDWLGWCWTFQAHHASFANEVHPAAK